MHRRTFLAALTLVTPPLARAAPAAALKIGRPWARPALAGRAGAGYLTITNAGRSADTLLGAESPVAARVTIHEMSMAGGIMRMRALPSLTIGAGAAVAFAPGGMHLMLEGLKRDLKVGDRVPATLTFAKAGKVAVVFAIQDAPMEMGHVGHM